MAKTSIVKGQRVVVRIKKNEWYVGTVKRISKFVIAIDFDDGASAKVSPEDFKHVHPIATKRTMYNPIQDIQARALFLDTSGKARKFELVFPPSATTDTYLTCLGHMVFWLHGVADRYKFSNAHLSIERRLGSVGVARTFRTQSATRTKYQRAIIELADAFAHSPEWRVQVSAGGKEFFSTNGLFRAVFYDIKNLLSTDPNERKIGLYLMLRALK